MTMHHRSGLLARCLILTLALLAGLGLAEHQADALLQPLVVAHR